MIDRLKEIFNNVNEAFGAPLFFFLGLALMVLLFGCGKSEGIACGKDCVDEIMTEEHPYEEPDSLNPLIEEMRELKDHAVSLETEVDRLNDLLVKKCKGKK